MVEALDDLDAADRLHPAAVAPEAGLPRALREVIERAVAFEEAEGRSDNVEQLTALYLDLMPRMLVEQIASNDRETAWLFHTPLDLAEMPRLRAARESWARLLAEAGLDSPPPLAGRTLADIYRSECFYGGVMPMLYGYPPDLAAYLAERDATGDPWGVLDRRLTGPLIHELSHLGRQRDALYPPSLDESVAGYLGILACRSIAFPDAGEDNAFFAAAWFAQVGQALAHRVGVSALVRAHEGTADWDAVLPPGLRVAFDALGWEQYLATRAPHFLGLNTSPQAWLALIWKGAEPGPLEAADHVMLRDALTAMCLRCDCSAGSYRAKLAAPPRPILVDVEVSPEVPSVSRALAPDEVDPAPPSYGLSPSLANHLRERGVRHAELVITDPSAIEDAAEALLVGKDTRGRGFRLSTSSQPPSAPA